jgi:hypothetical protein
MESVWMGIAQGPATTRVIAMTSPSSTILKAQLAHEPRHPRALGTLLEAIALWEGRPVRAALSAASSGISCDSNLFREAFSVEGGALYSVVWAHATAARRRRSPICGMGRFDDLERLVAEEVAR